MKIRAIALAGIALLATSSAFAAAPSPQAAEPQPARAHTIVKELAASMRDVLRAVTPELSLPKIELKLTLLDHAPR